jgi:hypothetical protein
MANVTITELPALSTMTDAAVMPVVAGNVTQQITGLNLKTYFGSSGGTPGGSNTQVQFNDSDTFGGVAGFTFDKTSNTLTVGTVIQSGIGNVNGYNAYFANNITVQGTVQAGSLSIPAGSGTFYGNPVTGANALFAGVPGYTTLGSNVVAQFAANVDSYAQINFQNINTGAQSTTEIIVTADNGTDTTFFGDFGIAGSNYIGNIYNDVGTAVYPDDTYVYSQGNGSGTGGNLSIGSNEPSGVVRIFAGGSNIENVVATVSSTGISVVGNITTSGTSGNITGANVISANVFALTPGGGTITEGIIPAYTSLTGNTIVITPSGGTSADQQLVVYPTAGPIVDANHLHLTSGNLYNTELFLGDDFLYVKLANTGNIVINTNDNVGNSAQWTFDTTGDLTFPSGNLFIRPDDAFFSNSAVIAAVNNLITLSSGANGGTSSLWLEDFGNIGTSNIAAVYANPTPGSGNVRIAVGSNGGAGPKLWDFEPNGNLNAPGNISTNGLFNGSTKLAVGASDSIRMFVPAADANIGSVAIITSADGNAVSPQNPGVVLHLTGQEGTPARIYNDSVANYAAFVGRSYNGNVNLPTAVTANAIISRYAATPYTSAGWPAKSTARIDMVTTEAQTDTNQGTEIQFWTTSLGSNSIAKVMSMTNNDIKIDGDLAATGNATFSTNIDYINQITVSGTTYDAQVVIHDISADNVAQLILTRDSTSVQPILATALNNSDDPTVNVDVVPGQTLFQIATLGFAGTDYKEFGGLVVQVDDSPDIEVSETSSPGKLVFAVTANGSISTAPALTIYNDTTAEFAGNVSATGNITGGNITTAGAGGDLVLTGGNVTGANVVTANVVITTPVGLANLTAVAGGRAFVNNANLIAAGNFGAQINDGGSNVVPVWSDGANWYIG